MKKSYKQTRYIIKKLLESKPTITGVDVQALMLRGYTYDNIMRAISYIKNSQQAESFRVKMALKWSGRGDNDNN